MTIDFTTAMRRALDQTRGGDPAGATHTLLAALGAGGSADAAASQPDAAGAATLSQAPTLRVQTLARGITQTVAATSPGVPSLAGTPTPVLTPKHISPQMPGLPRARGMAGLGLAGGLAVPGRGRATSAAALAPGAGFESRDFACAQGTRSYRLYVPAARPDGVQGLVVMLHGCTQNPDDFALGTGMNALAERQGLIVAYPAQGSVHNAQGCWNWFRPGDQARDAGEPAILAGLTRAVAAEFGVNPARVFVAGLSAGGAMAAVLGTRYPELYAAIGVHSGLACGAARDVVSAFAAMRGTAAAGSGAGRPLRTIVFHGTADGTVHPTNAGRVVAAAQADTGGATLSRQGIAPGGRRFTATATCGADGASLTELWLVEGAGHAWSGGALAGSYTDPSGPDASAEMIRFFQGGAFDGAAR